MLHIFPVIIISKSKEFLKINVRERLKKLSKIPIRLIHKILIKRRRMLLISLCTVNLCKNFHFSELSA